MSEAAVLERVEDGVGIITLNRPERMNAVNYWLMTELTPAVQRAADNPDVGCVVIRGAGRGFCAGGDLKEGAAPPKELRSRASSETRGGGLRRGAEAARLLHDMPKITIAMVNGPVAGAGIGIAGACDLRFASPTATFLSAYDRIGGAGDYSATWSWVRILGAAKARQLFFLGEKFNAEEALAFGIYNKVVPDDQLEAHTMAFAKKIAGGPSASWAYLKQNLNLAEELELAAHLDIESLHMGLSTAAAAAFFKAKAEK